MACSARGPQGVRGGAGPVGYPGGTGPTGPTGPAGPQRDGVGVSFFSNGTPQPITSDTDPTILLFDDAVFETISVDSSFFNASQAGLYMVTVSLNVTSTLPANIEFMIRFPVTATPSAQVAISLPGGAPIVATWSLLVSLSPGSPFTIIALPTLTEVLIELAQVTIYRVA
jgi:hypothetical protein